MNDPCDYDRAGTGRSLVRLVGLGLATVLAVACAAPVPLKPAVVATPTTTATAPAIPVRSPIPPSPSPAVVLLGDLPRATLDPASEMALQAVLDSAVHSGAPDAIAAVITEKGRWAGAAGVAGPEGRLATRDDEFAIASITKTFTAALIMRLAEQGRMDLDAPLASYLGDLEVDTNGATVRQALEMRAGLADNGSEVADQIVADPARAWTRDEIVARYVPPVSPPGAYRYSSPGYELLAFAAEHVTGMSYGSALRAEVLDPVNADRILDQADGVITPQPWALPIGEHLGRFSAADMGAGGALSCISSATRGVGAGSVASDAPSLAAWVWQLFAGEIVNPATLGTMLAGAESTFAFGLEPAPYPEPGAVAASGGKTGYGSQFVYFPASRAVIVIFVNDPNFVVEPTVTQLLSSALST